MKRSSTCAIACTAIALLLAGPAAARTEEGKSLNEKILDILLEEGTIDQKRYDDLMEEAQAEKRAAALPAVAAADDDPKGWKVYWKDGSRIERNDGKYKIKFGGRIQYDMAGTSVSGRLLNQGLGTEGTGDDFRRARLFMQGVFGEYGIFKAQYDFAGQDADLKDVYAGLQEMPLVGTVRAGHFKEPQSIGMTTSSKYITFMERSLPVLAFTSERNAGIGFHNQYFDERMTFHSGVFRRVDDSGEDFSNQGNYDAGFRVTGLPVYEEEGGQVLHTGIWYSHQFGRDDLQYDPIDESNTLGSLNDMPAIPVDGVQVLGTELAGVFGPFSFQNEFIVSFVDGDGTANREFWGNSLQASYFLTGERRVYDRKLAAFGRTKPKEPFSLAEGTWGALEVAGRWSYLTLNDGSVRGGILNNFTLGANWYLFSNLRLMANYVNSQRNGLGEAHVFQSRVSLDF